MNLLALTLISHITVAHFKPLNILRKISTCQTAETPVKINRTAVAEAFGRAA